MKLRWMPIDIGWAVSETTRFNAEESGAYFLLLMSYWAEGELPTEDRSLALIARLTLRRWNKIRSSIEAKFQMPGWRHPYLDSLRAKSEEGYNRRISYLKALDERRPDPAEWAIIRQRIFERDNYTCSYCQQRGGDLECDHIIPISRGGANDNVNLTTSCKPCNQSKGALLLSEWRP